MLSTQFARKANAPGFERSPGAMRAEGDRVYLEIRTVLPTDWAGVRSLAK